jgi:serine/threonine-protein kinase ULK4
MIHVMVAMIVCVGVGQLPQAKRGTPCYMAPELFQEGSVHSFGSDLWALGCVMYECYSGRPPFVSSSFTQLVNSIISDPAPPLWGNPSRDFEDLVNRLLVKDPIERIQWDELRNHPFWRAKCKPLPLPPQPALENFLRMNQRSSSPEEKEQVPARAALTEKTTVEKGSVSERSYLREKAQSEVKKPEIKQVGANTVGKATSVPENNNPVQRENGRKVTKGPIGSGKDGNAKANGGVPVNLLRLSKIVKTNLLKETENDTYRQQTHANGTADDTDVTLENHDLELNFGEGAESNSEEEDDTGSNGPSPSASTEDKDLPKASTKPNHSKSEKEDRGESGSAAEESLPESPPQSESGGRAEDRHTPPSEVEANHMDSLRHVAATPPGVGIPRKGLHRAPPVSDQPKKDPPVCVPSHTIKPSVVLSQSLWHPSDLSVRPIMLNRRIEKVSTNPPSYGCSKNNKCCSYSQASCI